MKEVISWYPLVIGSRTLLTIVGTKNSQMLKSLIYNNVVFV